MDLHRAKSQPDWMQVTAAERNYWQKLAFRTNGIITPPNILTIGGFLMCLGGLWAVVETDYWLGLILIIVGRLLDIADGMVAEKTGTKSPLGESLDAGFDKLITVVSLVVLVAAGVLVWYVMLLLLIPHLLIALVSGRMLAKRQRLHPSRYGKYSMALASVGIGGLILLEATNQTGVSTLSILVYSVVAGSIVLGSLAAIDYTRQSRSKVAPL